MVTAGGDCAGDCSRSLLDPPRLNLEDFDPGDFLHPLGSFASSVKGRTACYFPSLAKLSNSNSETISAGYSFAKRRDAPLRDHSMKSSMPSVIGEVGFPVENRFIFLAVLYYTKNLERTWISRVGVSYMLCLRTINHFPPPEFSDRGLRFETHRNLRTLVLPGH